MDINKQCGDTYEKLTRLVLASEEWAKVYKKDMDSFSDLVKAEAKLDRNLLGYFKGLADRAIGYVDWYAYQRKLIQVTAADEFQVDVIVNDIPDLEDGLIIEVIYEPIALAVASGIYAGETIYKISLPQETVQQVISKTAKEKVAYLVGKKVDKDGNIVPSKKPEYHINEVTRQQIRDSIRLSLSLGETQELATKRLQKVIKDPKRAAKIASTEAVNAYQGGQYRYALATDAVGKEWQTLNGACPLCVGNKNAGTIPINQAFPSGDQAPSSHPYDRCGLRYVYQEELDLEK